MVRFNRVKRVAVEIKEINDIVSEPLPQDFPLVTPGGEGKLSILGITLSIPSSSESPNDVVNAEVLCNFCVTVKKSIIYNTHLMLMIEAKPDYSKQNKTINIKDIKINHLELISDQYSVIKDTRHLMGGIIPDTLQPLVDLTLFSAKTLLKNKTVSSFTQYLSLYTSGSKQKVLDYHRADIENKIIELSQDDEMAYQLNQSVFEEKLFADFGNKIVIEDGQLFFVFVSD